jgi:glucosyl-dolichyl phosphate glucuronosyltransferase
MNVNIGGVASPSNGSRGLSAPCDISVVLCTWNRAAVLPSALKDIAAQEAGGARYEIIIVDNNSSDSTPRVIESFQRTSPVPVTHVFEKKQGLSYARNAGIAAASAPVVAFTDDDVTVTPGWVSAIRRAFEEFPQVSFIGGKVLPIWPSRIPSWISSRLSSLALQDYGDKSFFVTAGAERKCLIGANLACRREVFDRVGPFAPELQRVEGGIGSMEDEEFEARATAAGETGLYDPRIVVRVPVPDERLTKRYHRSWYFEHGRFLSLHRDAEIERSSFRMLGVPGHLFRGAGENARRWIAATAKGEPADAFFHQLQLCLFAGFFSDRLRNLGRSRAYS